MPYLLTPPEESQHPEVERSICNGARAAIAVRLSQGAHPDQRIEHYLLPGTGEPRIRLTIC